VVLLSSTRRPRHSTGTRLMRIRSRSVLSFIPSRRAASGAVYVGRVGERAAAPGDAEATSGEGTSEVAALTCGGGRAWHAGADDGMARTYRGA
jgi:hypothetical protein